MCREKFNFLREAVISAGNFHWIFDSFYGAEYRDSGIKIRTVRGCPQYLSRTTQFYDVTFWRLKSSVRFPYFPFPFFLLDFGFPLFRFPFVRFPFFRFLLFRPFWTLVQAVTFTYIIY